MKPFYRMLTHTALILQSVIIIYLLCPHHEDHAPRGTESCRSNRTDSVIQTGVFCNAAKAEWKNEKVRDFYVLRK